MVTIYHNPKCSKSRETLKLLKDKNIEPTVVEYMKNPPSRVELKAILAQLGKKPQDIIRFKEDRAAELKLSPTDTRSDEIWLDLMLSNPVLIERPIVVANGKAAIGRPPEQVLAIL